MATTTRAQSDLDIFDVETMEWDCWHYCKYHQQLREKPVLSGSVRIFQSHLGASNNCHYSLLDHWMEHRDINNHYSQAAQPREALFNDDAILTDCVPMTSRLVRFVSFDIRIGYLEFYILELEYIFKNQS